MGLGSPPNSSQTETACNLLTAKGPEVRTAVIVIVTMVVVFETWVLAIHHKASAGP